MKSVLLFGASGLTGTALLNELLNDANITSIVVMGRRALDVQHDKLTYLNVDFAELDNYLPHFAVDAVFCCLGTTIRKAKSQAAFKSIDVDLVVNIARLAKQANVKKFSVISALGASADSSVFYNRCKGEMEQQLTSLFSTSNTQLVVCRPSLLIGDRDESRLGESIGNYFFKGFGWLFAGPLKRYKPIHAQTLATAMFKATNESKQPLIILENKELLALGRVA